MPTPHHRNYPNRIELAHPKWATFAAEIDLLGREMKRDTSLEDFAQLRKFARWGRAASALGYLTAWIAPNPLSVLAISLGNFTRWGTIFHQVAHGAYDKIPGVPKRYQSKYFARGYRRFLDWFDWMTPKNWHEEHNKLHHYYLGSEKDPDIVWRNAEKIRNLPAPIAVRYLVAGIIACIWKPFYYAPNTIAEARHHLGLLPTNRIKLGNWSPFTPAGRELWFAGLLPYATFRFVLLPALFLPLGRWAAFNVFLNSILAELATNIHSFATIGPNHTGDDVYTFANSSKGRSEFYLRQIVGTVNFPAHSEWRTFLYGGMNYQIEHHVWPEATLRQCQMARPKLKAICAKYGVRYHEAELLPRVVMTIKTMAGSCKPLQANATATLAIGETA